MNFEAAFNRLWIGLMAGILAPTITFFIVFFYTFDNYTFEQFIYFLKTMRVLSKLLSLCVYPNLAVFFLFIWANYLKGARGVLASTFVLAVIVFIVPRII